MDPQQPEPTPSFNAPIPSMEQGVPPYDQGAEPFLETGETVANVALEHGVSAAPPPALASVPPIPQDPSASIAPASQIPPGATPAQSAMSQNFGMPQIADDTDLIEKEWVDKAKEIVEQTAHDPHLQNQEINKVKVEYLKKRYNKDVKLTND